MSSNDLGLSDVLGSVAWSLQHEIAPKVSDEYAASLCKTAVALLRSCIVRAAQEGPFLMEDNRCLRAALATAADALKGQGLNVATVAGAAGIAGHVAPFAHMDVAALTAEAEELQAALAVTSTRLRAAKLTPEVAAAQAAVDSHLNGHLAKQAAWLLEPFAGDIR